MLLWRGKRRRKKKKKIEFVIILCPDGCCVLKATLKKMLSANGNVLKIRPSTCKEGMLLVVIKAAKAPLVAWAINEDIMNKQKQV